MADVQRLTRIYEHIQTLPRADAVPEGYVGGVWNQTVHHEVRGEQVHACIAGWALKLEHPSIVFLGQGGLDVEYASMPDQLRADFARAYEVDGLVETDSAAAHLLGLTFSEMGLLFGGCCTTTWADQAKDRLFSLIIRGDVPVTETAGAVV